MNPRFNFRSTPFDSIRIFCGITRLGGLGLSTRLIPALRTEKPRRLYGAIKLPPVSGLFVTRRRVTVSGLISDKTCP